MKPTPRFRAFFVYIIIGIFLISNAFAAGLEVSKVKAYVNSDRDSGLDSNGGELSVAPGDHIELQFTLENTYEDKDIEDVSLDGEIDDIDDDYVDEFDIDEDDREVVSLQFEVPLDADEDTYELLVEFEAEDEDGNDIVLSDYVAEVEVEKEKHHLEVISAEFRNQVIACGEENTLHVELLNLGQKDVEGQIFVKSDDLKIALLGEEFEIDEDEYYKESFEFSVPKDVLRGEYQVFIVPQHRHYDEDEELHVMKLHVNCKQQKEEKELAKQFKVVQKKQVIILEDSVPNRITGHAVAPDHSVESEFENFVDTYKEEFAYGSIAMFALLLFIFMLLVWR